MIATRLPLALSATLILSLPCAPAVDIPSSGTLTVVIAGMRSGDGRVGVALYGSHKGFPYQLSQALRVGFADIRDGRSEITFRHVAGGAYAVMAFQDENNNQMLDRDWLGFLVEPTAVSNNLKRHIHRPTFDAAKFTTQDSLCIVIRLP